MPKASNCQQLRKNLHPNKHFSVLYGYNKQTHTLFIQKNTRICIVRHQGNPILILRSSYGAEDDLSCELKLHLSQGLYLDMHLFTDWSALHKQLSLDNMRDAGVYHWPAICDSLSASALIGDFSVVSGVLQGGRDLLYWLDACGVQMPVGHLRDQTLRDVSDNDTHCVLQRVSGLESTSSPAEKLSVSEMYCVEDMMSYLRPLGRNLVYSSPLGVSAFSTSHDASFEMSHVVELIHVIRAFMNLDFSNKAAGNEFVTPVHALEVKSMWRPYLETMRSNDADIRRSVLLLVSSQDSAQWEVAMHSLRNKTDHWLSDSPELRRRRVLEIINALMTYAVNHDGVVCASYAISYLCLQQQIAVSSLVSYIADLKQSRLISCMHKHCAAPSKYIGDQVGAYAELLSTHFTVQSLSVTQNYRSVPENIHFVVQVSLTVLLIVLPQDLFFAERVVHDWQQRCAECSIPTTYVAMTADAAYDGTPSMRGAHIAVLEYIETYSVENDIFIVLVGKEAIRAFRTPDINSSIIPPIVLGSVFYWNLWAPIVVAKQPGSCDGCCVEASAMAGYGHEIRKLLLQVRTRIYLLPTEKAYRAVLQKQLCYNYPGVDMDAAGVAFEFQDAYEELRIREYQPIETAVLDTIISRESIVDPAVMQDMSMLLESFVKQGRLYLAVYAIVKFRRDVGPEYDFVTGPILEGFSRKIRFVTGEISMIEKSQATNLLLEDITLIKKRTSLRTSMLMLLGAIAYDMGDTVTGAKWYQRTLHPPMYKSLSQYRSIWQQQRQQLTRRHNRIVTHYFTVASEHTEGLQNLLFSAKLAGIKIQVLGLGREYVDYSQKIEWYTEAIFANASILDSDVIVLMDAYDVVVSAPIRNIAEHLAHAPTPIVYCAENGIYPDASSPWFYYRGGDASSYVDDAGQGVPRFLNSGCVMGRAQQIRELFMEIKEDAIKQQDDQQTISRYYLDHPQVISLSSTYFRCGFKVPADTMIAYAYNMSLYVESLDHPVALFHANNKYSQQLYQRIVDGMKDVFSRLYAGMDGPFLLQAVHYLWDKEYANAVEVLGHPDVVRNMTIHGGSNILAEFLLESIPLAERETQPAVS